MSLFFIRHNYLNLQSNFALLTFLFSAENLSTQNDLSRTTIITNFSAHKCHKSKVSQNISNNKLHFRQQITQLQLQQNFVNDQFDSISQQLEILSMMITLQNNKTQCSSCPKNLRMSNR